MNKVFDGFRIMHICCRSLDVVDKTGIFVNTDVRLVAEMPLIAFLDGMRFGGALSVSIFCGGGRCDEG